MQVLEEAVVLREAAASAAAEEGGRATEDGVDVGGREGGKGGLEGGRVTLSEEGPCGSVAPERREPLRQRVSAEIHVLARICLFGLASLSLCDCDHEPALLAEPHER